MAEQPVEYRFKAVGAESTAQQIEELSRQLGELQRETKKVAETPKIGGVPVSVTLGDIQNVLSRVYAEARKVVETLHGLLLSGSEYSPMIAAVERLASRDLISRLTEVTGGLVANRTLIQETSQVLTAGIVSEDQWARGLRAITIRAQETGESVEGMVNTFAQIGAGGGIEALGRLGVNFNVLRQETTRAGHSLESAEGRIYIVNRAIEALEEITGSGSVEIANYGDAVTQLTNDLSRWGDNVTLVAAENDTLIQTVEAIRDGIASLLPEGEDLSDLFEEFARQGARAAATTFELISPLARLTAVMAQLAANILRVQMATSGGSFWNLVRGREPFEGVEPLDEMALALHRIADTDLSPIVQRLEALGDGAAASNREVSSLIGSLSRIRPDGTIEHGQSLLPFSDEEMGLVSPSPQSATEGGEIVSARTRRGGASRSGKASAEESARLVIEERIAEAIALSRYEEDQRGKALEESTGLLEIERLEREAILSLQEKASQESADLALYESEVREKTLALQTEAAEDLLRNQEKRLEGLREEAALAESISDITSSGLHEITSLLESQLAFREAEIQARLSSGEISEETAAKELEALDTWRKTIGGIMAAIEFVNAASQIAKAIGSYPDVIGIIAHSLAAAGHIAAGAMALSQLGGSASPPSGAKAAPTKAFSKKESSDSDSRPGKGGGATIMVVNASSARLATELSRAETRRERLGLTPGMRG